MISSDGLRTLFARLVHALEGLSAYPLRACANMVLRSLLAALVITTASAREVLGAIHLDAYTFDKVVTYHDILVKFDKYIPYGPKEDAFRELAKTVGELSTELLIGWIGVQDYGAWAAWARGVALCSGDSVLWLRGACRRRRAERRFGAPF